METIGSKEERSDIICNVLAMPVRRWLLILIIVFLFLGLGFFVFAGELFSL